MFGAGLGFFGPMGGGHFEASYRAFPLAFIDKQSAEYGDKVILPPSALDRLGEPGLAHSSCTCPPTT
jgi:ubiquitin fusion degradation protein 1